ncbi:hypothetical protein HD806DRAFT_361279 [Xylariaceae sp. AK1471]|nr:hypothetical protein HD806DRAFT_361279 [Xylariaceae sp. AK1471]
MCAGTPHIQLAALTTSSIVPWVPTINLGVRTRPTGYVHYHTTISDYTNTICSLRDMGRLTRLDHLSPPYCTCLSRRYKTANEGLCLCKMSRYVLQLVVYKLYLEIKSLISIRLEISGLDVRSTYLDFNPKGYAQRHSSRRMRRYCMASLLGLILRTVHTG